MESAMPYAVKIGTRLKKRDAPGYQLEIVELTTPEGDLPHARARIRISNYDLGVRLYSVSALQDSRLFIMESDPEDHIKIH